MSRAGVCLPVDGVYSIKFITKLKQIITRRKLRKLGIKVRPSYIQSGEINGNTAIGRFCSMGRNVKIGFHPKTHPVNWVSSSTRLLDYPPEVLATTVGHDVWVGDDVKIFAGVNIGTGAIIGTSSVVTKDVEPYQIVGGCPAKPIKHRFESAMVQSLLESKWWDKDISKLRKLDFLNIQGFSSSASLLPSVDYPLWRIDECSAKKH